MTLLPAHMPASLRGAVILTDRLGNMVSARSPSGHPPACIVRAGDTPSPESLIEFDQDRLAPQLRDILLESA